MLVSDDGEAEAAGRAVGHLSRKLGLTGGHLKSIFLAGAGRLATAGRQAAEQSARAERLQGEAGGLQHSLEQVDFALRQMSRERDALLEETQTLRDSLQRSRTRRRTYLVFWLLFLAAVAGVAAFVWLGPPLRPLLGLSYDEQAATVHTAEVRAAGASALAAADQTAPVLWQLPGNAKIPVRRLVWRNFNQWAETSLGGKDCFVNVTSLVLEPDPH